MLRPSKTENITLSLINDQIKSFPTDANAKITFKRINFFVFIFLSERDWRTECSTSPAWTSGPGSRTPPSTTQFTPSKKNKFDWLIFLRNRKEEFKQTQLFYAIKKRRIQTDVIFVRNQKEWIRLTQSFKKNSLNLKNNFKLGKRTLG